MSYETHPARLPGGTHRDSADHTRLRHGRDRHTGFGVGRYGQPAPMLFSRDGHNIFLGDIYRGCSAFLVCSGPSLTSHDLGSLQERGIVALSVNNAATIVRTQLWTSVDDPGNFSDVIWRDPAIMKFVPLCHMEKRFHTRDEEDLLVPSVELVGDMPNVFGYRRNECFQPQQWLYEDSFNWGNRSDLVDEAGDKGSRSVMYVALRLLYYLGIRRVYLLGCDFKMEVGKQNYAFPQDRSAGSVRGNNSSYRILNRRLKRLLPFFSAEGFEIFNCTPDSGLTVFPHLSFEEAIAEARARVPSRISTSGMYDRRAVRPGKPAANRLTRSGPPAQADASLRERVGSVADQPVERSSVTVVTAVDEERAKGADAAFASWFHRRPKSHSQRLVVAVDPAWKGLPDKLRRYLHRHTKVVPWPDNAGDSGSSRRFLGWTSVAAASVTTPWTLYISAHAIAPDGDYFDPSWIATPPPKGPAFIGNACPFSTSPDRWALWNQWIKSIGFGRPKASPIVEPEMATQRVRGGCLWYALIQTEWLRQISARFAASPPPSPDERLLPLCLEAEGSRVMTIDPERIGWRHPDGRPRFATLPEGEANGHAGTARGRLC